MVNVMLRKLLSGSLNGTMPGEVEFKHRKQVRRRSRNNLIQLLVGLACGASVAQTSPPADGGPIAEVEGWRQVGSPVWRFDPSGAEAGPEDVDGFLVSPETYADFTLTVEFWIEDDTNSGVFIRCGEVAEADDVNPHDCLEINLYDSHPNPAFRTGAIVTRVEPQVRVDTLGRWNRLEVRAEGGAVQVLVNGTPTAALDDARIGAGPVALQYAGIGLVRFRKLAITPLP